MESKWWEGLEWLYQPAENWPSEEAIADEAVIFSGCKGISSRSLKINTVDSNSVTLKSRGSDEHEASVVLADHVTETDNGYSPWYIIHLCHEYPSPSISETFCFIQPIQRCKTF